MLAKAQLLPAARAIATLLRSELPESISARLNIGSRWVSHGTRRSVQMLEIWDARQNALIPKSHFKYCIACDPLRLNPGAGPRDDGYFHAWLNTIRIYRDRVAIVEALQCDVRRLDLPGFRIGITPRAISIGRTFVWPSRPEQVVATIGPGVVELIRAVHPLLVVHIDRLATASGFDGTRAARPAPPGVLSPSRLREYTRSIPASWRREILRAQRHRCATCGADLRLTGHHIDHVVPFSRGGTTRRENLQALCPACNLRKGNHTS